MQKKIRIFDLNFDDQFRKEFLKGTKKILDDGFLTNHNYVRKFESLFSKFSKNKFSVAVNSGTAALELIFRSLDLSGKKVLISSNTFIATAIAVKSAGGIPVPIDIEKKYFSLCPKELEKKISKKIGAVVVVHIGGLITPKMNDIMRICKKNNVPLIEDCAQAYGSTLNGKPVGSFGIASAFSFQTTKVVTSGEGGIAVTNNNKLYKKFFSNRFYGFDYTSPQKFVSEGNNLKMTELAALMGVCDLQRSKRRIKKRIKLAKRYQYLLKNSSWKTLSTNKNSTSSYYKQIILSPIQRDIVEEEFKKNKISMTGGVYYVPLHRQPILGIKRDNQFKNSSFFSDYHFCPPCYPELKISDVDHICKVLLNLHN